MKRETFPCPVIPDLTAEETARADAIIASFKNAPRHETLDPYSTDDSDSDPYFIPLTAARAASSVS